MHLRHLGWSTLLVAAACGGQTNDDPSGAGASPALQGGAGGMISGGGAGIAGSSGSGSGGTAAGAGASGWAGSANAGGIGASPGRGGNGGAAGVAGVAGVSGIAAAGGIAGAAGGGSPRCTEALVDYARARIAAQRCDPRFDSLQCQASAPGRCCPVTINRQEDAALLAELLQVVTKLCGPAACPEIPCPIVPSLVCMPTGAVGAGECS
jgi:hypothetical protein